MHDFLFFGGERRINLMHRFIGQLLQFFRQFPMLVLTDRVIFFEAF